MILVTGATGNAGAQVVRALVARGQRVRAFVREPERARERLGDGVALAVGDFEDLGSVRAALEGVGTVVLSCADDPRRVGWETRAIDEAVAAGVRRIVKLSTIGAEVGAPVAFWDWHGRVEEHLRASPVDAVILRSGFYMTNLLAEAARVARESAICAPLGDARIAMIDPRDVGAAAAAVVSGPRHAGRVYELTGPEAITYERVAAELSTLTGRGVRYVDVSEHAARQGMLAAGLPEFVAEQLLRVYAQLRRGAAERVTSTVEELTGRPPRTFAEFARDHASAFGPQAVVATQ